MPPDIKKLGELIFNGVILFLSISFGLFTFSLASGKITVTSIFVFALFTVLVVCFGIASLICAFFGIRNNNIILVYWAGASFLLMIILLVFAYAQIYLNTVSTSVTLMPNP